MKICSACLVGLNCRYDGKNNLEKAPEKLLGLYKKGELIPVCPEQLGGLATPRSGARIVSGDGNNVLDGTSRVITDNEEDVTDQYLRGAYETLKVAQDLGIKEGILKQKSPSCGCDYTQGGMDKREIMRGNGVTTALLKRNGVVVKSESDF